MLTLCRHSKSRSFTLRVDPVLRFPNTTHAHAGESLLSTCYTRVTQKKQQSLRPRVRSRARTTDQSSSAPTEINQRQILEIFSLISYSHLHSMFYIVGLGLCDEKDITVRGLEVCLVVTQRVTAKRVSLGCQRLHKSVSRSLHLHSNGAEGEVGAHTAYPIGDKSS